MGKCPGPWPGHPPGGDEAPLPSCAFTRPFAHFSLLSCLFPPLPSLLLEGSRPQCLELVPRVDSGFAWGSSCPQPVVSQIHVQLLQFWPELSPRPPAMSGVLRTEPLLPCWVMCM